MVYKKSCILYITVLSPIQNTVTTIGINYIHFYVLPNCFVFFISTFDSWKNTIKYLKQIFVLIWIFYHFFKKHSLQVQLDNEKSTLLLPFSNPPPFNHIVPVSMTITTEREVGGGAIFPFRVMLFSLSALFVRSPVVHHIFDCPSVCKFFTFSILL